jgi:hypothetical protein
MMRSRRAAIVLCPALLSAAIAVAQGGRTAPRFFPDDPLWVDNDTRHDASAMKNIELSEAYDFIENTFARPGDRQPIRAVNVNTLGEVPDSSWFTNRIGVRDMPLAELVRGPNKFDPADAPDWQTWVVTAGKGPGGFHPGFRAERTGDPGQVYQLEVDPHGYPRLATGAEIVGTLIYHALGYHVQDVYPVKVHPRNISVAPTATIRDASGRRRFTQHDLDNILRHAARDSDGRVYFSATRYEEGDDIGHFRYYGVRTDDPNDLYPHEHRRELRANRVFAAWLAHDDSRAVNTRNLKVTEGGRVFARHYMHDFGAVLGSATRFPEPPTNNYQYFLETRASLIALASFGLYTQPALRVPFPDGVPASAGWFESAAFDPQEWKPNYPNAAFANLQPEDAFWGARLVSRFADEAIRAVVAGGGYDDPEAVNYIARTLIERRDKIARVWLNGVNPIADAVLTPDGVLTFTNAAVAARVAGPGGEYTIAWARFDNETGESRELETVLAREPRVAAPPALLADARFILATIVGRHPEYPGWTQPARVYFRRDGDRWTTVGLYR